MAKKGLMHEAIDKEDFDRMEKGLAPRPKIKQKLASPDPPCVENQLQMADIAMDLVTSLDARRKIVRNQEGMIFIGFEVTIGQRNKKPLTGWLTEDTLYTLKREVGDRVDTSKVEF